MPRMAVTTRELHPPTPTELNVLLAHVAARDPMLHVLLVLAATTGARRAQLLALRWDNIHHDTMRISFCAGWVEGPDGPVLAATKTKRRHSVDLDADTYSCSPPSPTITSTGSCSGRPRDQRMETDPGPKAFLRHRRTPVCARSAARSSTIHGHRDAPRRHPLVVVLTPTRPQRPSTTLNHYAHAVPAATPRPQQRSAYQQTPAPIRTRPRPRAARALITPGRCAVLGRARMFCVHRCEHSALFMFGVRVMCGQIICANGAVTGPQC